MTLRARVSLISTLLTVIALIGFGIAAYVVFVRQQERHLRTVLAQDLARVGALLDRPQVGNSFTQSKSGSFVLQFVTRDEKVIMSWGDEALLPLVDDIQHVSLGNRPYLIGSSSWTATNGTIRLGHDISDAVAARGGLARSLVATGLVVALMALLLGLISSRLSLAPLNSVSRQARGLDPRSPATIAYAGPKDEVGDLVHALNSALDAIRARQSDERAFLTEIAHELAAPLTLVAYHVADVRREHPGDSRLSAASGAAQELLRTSQDLLVLARGELERPLRLEVIDLADLMARVANEYPGLRTATAHTTEVVADPERLMQVIRNLVRNAIQAAGAASKVQVRLRQEGDNEIIEVTDEGPGMSEETLARAFERLYSASRGVGVGLTVAKSLVEQHRGLIEVSSELGKGTCFTVRLPSLDSQLVTEQ
jgi:two-component system OmpR family sensor kinase